MNSIDENTLDTIKWLYLVNLIFYISTTISRIFVVRDVSIEFEKNETRLYKTTRQQLKKYIYLILKNVVEDATFHIIILLLQIFKTKNFPFLPYEGNDPLLEQA